MTEIKLPDPPHGMSSERRDKWERDQLKTIKKNGGLETSLENESIKVNRSFRNLRNLSIVTMLLGAGVLSAAYFTSCNKKVEIPSGYVSEQILVATRDSAYSTGYEDGMKTSRDSLVYYRSTMDSLIGRTEEDKAIINRLEEDIRNRAYLQGGYTLK